jgi:hypothetical protein
MRTFPSFPHHEMQGCDEVRIRGSQNINIKEVSIQELLSCIKEENGLGELLGLWLFGTKKKEGSSFDFWHA